MRTLNWSVLVLFCALSLGAADVPPQRRFLPAVGDAFFVNGLGPATTNNDDSCDIGVYPAATLLLPYFEVDVSNSSAMGPMTIFTITNVSRLPQIAHVTLWTDRAYPVLDFNIFLTGYDVQAINLYDVIIRGIIAPPSGTSSSSTSISPRGSRSATSNPNLDTAYCSSLPGLIPVSLVSAVRSALTTGTMGTIQGIGNTHTNAIGFATFDVVSSCGTLPPTDPGYYQTLLFDNVLTGDYMLVNPSPPPAGSDARDSGYATNNSMVHIRAIPEGGPAGTVVPTNLPTTFYSRYGSAKSDRRQPLPSSFAARIYDGGELAHGARFTMWREGVTAQNSPTSAYAANGRLPVTEVVRFDDHENAAIFSIAGDVDADDTLTRYDASGLVEALFAARVPPPSVDGFADANYDGSVTVADAFYLFNYAERGGPTPGGCQTGPCRTNPITPVTMRAAARDASVFPAFFRGTAGVGGWIYLNLAHPTNQGRSQSWVTVQQSKSGLGFTNQRDATMLGNGCTPAPAVSSTNKPIGPAANANP